MWAPYQMVYRLADPPGPCAPCGMAKLNHVSIQVRDWQVARDWYVTNVGLTVEFEIPERKTAALKDEYLNVREAAQDALKKIEAAAPPP